MNRLSRLISRARAYIRQSWEENPFKIMAAIVIPATPAMGYAVQTDGWLMVGFLAAMICYSIWTIFACAALIGGLYVYEASRKRSGIPGYEYGATWRGRLSGIICVLLVCGLALGFGLLLRAIPLFEEPMGFILTLWLR